jgi:hypothetical protein
MKRKIAKYVSECDTCQRVKASHLKASGRQDRGKYIFFSSASLANENIASIFVGFSGQRKYMYFHRLSTKMRLFSSILFRRPIFVGRPTNIYIFDGF